MSTAGQSLAQLPLVFPPLTDRAPTEVSITRKMPFAVPQILGPSKLCVHDRPHDPITGKHCNYTKYYNRPKPTGIPLGMKVHKGSLFTDAGYIYYSGCYDISPEWTSESRTSLPQITDRTISQRNNTANIRSCVRAGESIISRLSSRERPIRPSIQDQF